MNQSSTRKKKSPFILAAILVVIAVLVYIGSRTRQRSYGVLTPPLERTQLTESVYGIGTIMARNSNQLRLGVPAKVRQIHVTEGDFVHRGQKLIDFDETGPMSAPFSGTITYLPVRVGETAFPQSVLLSIVDLADRYIVVSLEQRAAIQVKQGQLAKISFESMRDRVFEGTVQSVYSNNAAFLVRIGAKDLPPQLLPGMTGDVAIIIRTKKEVLSIPVAAIEEGQVNVKRGGLSPKKITVKTGILDGPTAEVIDGDLHEGDQLYIRKHVGP